jgi:hypothetical protein
MSPIPEETKMLKTALATAVLVVALAVPAMAMEMKCDDASMTMMKTQMDGMKDMAMKDKAMKEMDMAKGSMKMNKMEDCKKHMDKAMKSMM